MKGINMERASWKRGLTPYQVKRATTNGNGKYAGPDIPKGGYEEVIFEITCDEVLKQLRDLGLLSVSVPDLDLSEDYWLPPKQS